jgi:hypothetical protein
MKRNEFKLLMEDWKRNFVVEDSVVSNTLNEGYTELDRMVLEEGLKDIPIVKTAIGLFGVAAISALLSIPGGGGLKIVSQMVDQNPASITSPSTQDSYPAGVGSFLSVPGTLKSAEYQKLFNSDDVQNIIDDLDNLSEKSVTSAISSYVDSELEKDPDFDFPEKGEDLGDMQEMLKIFKNELPEQVGKFLSQYEK